MGSRLWGPLAGLIGTWESDYDGLDVSFHNENGKIGETIYREKLVLKPFGPVDNADRCLYGLDYRTAIYRRDEDLPFHTEVGYWMWDAEDRQLTKSFVMPQAQAVMAGATVEPDATKFTLKATIGSDTYGILSNLHMNSMARTTRFDATISVGDDSFSYDETTVIEHKKYAAVVMHTDRNTLKLVSREE